MRTVVFMWAALLPIELVAYPIQYQFGVSVTSSGTAAPPLTATFTIWDRHGAQPSPSVHQTDGTGSIFLWTVPGITYEDAGRTWSLSRASDPSLDWSLVDTVMAHPDDYFMLSKITGTVFGRLDPYYGFRRVDEIQLRLLEYHPGANMDGYRPEEGYAISWRMVVLGEGHYVPEPGTCLAALIGLAFVVGCRRRKAK